MKQQLLRRQNSQSLINAKMFFSSKKWWIVPQLDNVITASRVKPDHMTQQKSASVRYELQSIPEKLSEKTIIIYLWPNSNF